MLASGLKASSKNLLLPIKGEAYYSTPLYIDNTKRHPHLSYIT